MKGVLHPDVKILALLDVKILYTNNIQSNNTQSEACSGKAISIFSLTS